MMDQTLPIGIDSTGINATLEERRGRPRYRVQEGAFVALSPGYHKVGRIIDFGVGGLAFTYVGNNAEADEPSRLALFFSTGEPFYVDSIPILTVYDHRIHGGFQEDHLTLRRCGVRFGEMKRSLISDVKVTGHIRHYAATPNKDSHQIGL